MDAVSPPPARPRLSVGVGAAAVLVLVVLIAMVVISALSPRGDSEIVATTGDSSSSSQQRATPLATSSDNPGTRARPGLEPDGAPDAGIFVHVLGAVAHPGLYELREGDRVVDAVAAAGGYTAEADQAQLNLARVVTDGEQLYAPAVGELPPPVAAPDVPGGAGGAGGSGGGAAQVNLNKADSLTLETLPRIGPETAKKIIDYRQSNGPFTSVDQLLEVPGIGQKTLDGLRESVVL